MNRRTMLKRTAEGSVALAMASGWPLVPASLWGQAGAQGQVFDPRRFGAKGDGTTKDTRALQAAVDACTQSGGGTVLVGRGTYVSGTLVLKSNVTLELQAGAKILGSPDFADFFMPPEGIAASKGQQYPRFIFALNAENVSLIGPGTIDGNGPAYFAPGNHPPPKPGEEYKDIAGLDMMRVHAISPMVVMANIKNLRIENITLQNSVGWALHPVGVIGGVIRNVKVRNPVNTPNTDGIDPTSCQNLLIDNCDIVTGDDAICVKSYNMYGGNQICSNVTITNCRVSTCCNGIRIGTDNPNPIENIIVRNCEIYSVPGPYNVRPISGVSVVSVNGSTVKGITFDGITVSNARSPIYLRLGATRNEMKALQASATPLHGTLEDVTITNLRATGASLTSTITGIPGLRVSNVSLNNIVIGTEEPGKLAFAQAAIDEKESDYPNPSMFGRLPSYGLYVRHTDGLTLQNVNVASQVGDPRPMLSCDDVERLQIQRVSGTASDPSQAFLDLKNAREVTISGNQAPAGTTVYAKVSGANSHNVQFQGNDFSQSKSPVLRGLEVPQDGVRSVN